MSVEAAARKDLANFPPYMRTGAIAACLLTLARRYDNGLGARDACLVSREIRLAIKALSELAPLAIPADPVDELRARREQRLSADGPA